MKNNGIGPFVKWAGGKKQLLDKLKERMPAYTGKYYEPFIGGGALFLALQPMQVVINDVNEQLLNVYRQLRQDAGLVIASIKELDKEPCDKERYLSLRAKYNKAIHNGELDVEMAALMIWINKHCFNGLYRVNSLGEFNVPYNNKVLGNSADEANLLAIGNYLKQAKLDIRCGDFALACEDVKSGDFVYFDSPYVPVSKSASFTDYAKTGFTQEDHVRLADLFRKLDRKGVKLMLSNHDVPLVRELYTGFKIDNTNVRRNISRDANKRTGSEVIITNYL